MIRKITVALFAIFLLSGCTGSSSSSNYTEGECRARHIADFEQNVGNIVYFALNSSTLSSEGQATLARQAEWLNGHGLFNATVEGHCDERGTREYNVALGEKRAAAVHAFLTAQGVDASRLDTISYGKERPAVMGSNEAAWAQNRRGVTSLR